ncbi:MAG: UvrB/UvrC motif-containing protein [Clostridiales bacterium]
MKCQNCGNKEAVMQVSTVSNGVKNIKYICNECANHLFESNLSFQMNNPLQMMANIMGNYGRNVAELPPQNSQCPGCGTTYKDFLQRGRFGCAKCYDTFTDKLPPIFDKLHFSHEYCGKMPQCAGILEDKDKLALLEREKNAAVEREDYERAAELQRDIRNLKKEVKQ